MPLPMVPAPRTATVRTASGFNGDSAENEVQQNHGKRGKIKMACGSREDPSVLLAFDGQRHGIASAQTERRNSAVHAATLHLIKAA